MTQQLPEGFVLDDPMALPEGFEIEPQLTETQKYAREQEKLTRKLRDPKKGMFAQIGEAIVGKEAQETKNIPELMGSGVFEGQPKGKLAAISAALPFTPDPMEMAKIIENMGFDDIAITYNITEDRQPYPVITNRKTGRQAVLNKSGLSPIDIAQAAGEMAAFSLGGPANLATGPLKAMSKEALRNVAIQGGIEGGQAMAGGDFDPDQVALAGAMGGAFKGAEELASTGGRLATSEISQEAAEEIANAQRQGLDLITSDVIEPTTRVGKFAQQVGENAPVLGMGSVQAQRQKQREQMIQDFAQDYQTSYDDILQSLTDKREKVKKASISARQKTVDRVKNMPLESSNTVAMIDDQILKATTLPNGQPRRTVDKGLVEMLENYKADLQNDPYFLNLEMLRTNFRQDLLNNVSPTDMSKGAEKQIYKAMTEDMDAVVRNNMTPNEFRQWKRSNAVYGKELEKLKNTKFKELLKQSKDISSREVDNQIFSVHDTARKGLYRSLDDNGRRNARAAIVNTLVDKAGSPDQFVNLAKKHKDVIETFFKGREKRELQGLVKALDASRSAQKASVATQTGQQNMPYIAGGAALIDLGGTIATLGSAGLLSRVYESIPMRNALLRLQASPKGSKNFEKYLNDVAYIANSALQTYRQQQQETTERDVRSEQWAN